jgi:aspartate-semialdehyde dehydrogenase
VPGVTVAFSALDAAVAGEAELAWARAGALVSSNARNHRMEPDVPLVLPEVNAEHFDLLPAQRKARGLAEPGGIMTNGNCSAIGLVMALAPIQIAFGLEEVVVTTMQAASGAGYPGVPSLDLLGNVIPFIAGEEEKIERELGKILGGIADGVVRPAAIAVSAHCHRVPTVEGHLEAVSLELERAATAEEAMEVLTGFRGEVAALGLPSAPARPIVVRREADRPQPRLDRDEGDGMSVVVGRVRPCGVFTLRMSVLSHNTVRGAAGATVLNAELLAARGLLPRRASR